MDGRRQASELKHETYEALRGIANGCLSGQRRGTLRPTMLAHEAWMRLERQGRGFADGDHFLSTAAIAMRQIMTDLARRRNAIRRGGQAGLRIDVDGLGNGGEPDVEALDLTNALEELSRLSPRQARIIELRFLAGCTNDETARILSISERTVRLDARMAQAWLRGRLDR